MRSWNWLTLVSVLFVCVSCGKKGQDKAPWPAVIVNISNISESNKSAVRSSLQHLNEKLGVAAISEGSSNTNQFSISIKQVAPSTQNQDRAGLATFDGETCEVQLAQTIFEVRTVLLEPVLWHELGHCAGLQHDPTPGEIMYHSTTADGRYTTESIDRFLKAFASAAGLSVK